MALRIGCGGAELDKGSSGYAPDSIGGKVAITTIISGTGAPSTGTSTITFTDVSTYTDVWSGGTTDTGSFTYVKTAPGMGTIVLNSGGGTVGTVILTFTSYTGGTYSYSSTGGLAPGEQTGTYTLN